MNRFIAIFAFGLLTIMAPVVSHAADLKPITTKGSVKMVLIVATTPLKTGKNTLTLKVSDAQGKPLILKDIKVAITQSAKEMEAMGMAGMVMGAAKATITPLTPGIYEIKTSLPFGGKWDIQVSLTKPIASSSFSLAVQ